MAKRPNIVITIADDQQPHTVGALGLRGISTPALDDMVEGGTCFTQAHHFGSTHAAICAPSRAMLHAGRNYFNLPLALHSKWRFGELSERERDEFHQSMKAIPLLGQLLGQNGYHTFGTGKWHNERVAFNQSFQAGRHIFFGGMSDHDRVPIFDYDPSGRYPASQRRIGESFSSDLFADAAIEFIDRYDGDEPFFLYVAFTAPHDPRTPPSRYDEMYRRDQIELPPNFMPLHPFDNGDIYNLRDELLAPWPRTVDMIRNHMGDYYGMISHMDQAIGRIRHALTQKEIMDDTVFIHTGDHGLAIGEHGLIGKQSMYEHSVRVPLLMTGPRITAGRKIDALTYQHDLYPTLLEIAGIQVPPTCDFLSLLPLLDGKSRNVRHTIFSTYMNFQRMVKDKQYKLVRYYQQGGDGCDILQLFDYLNDPNEMSDLIGEEDLAGCIESLQVELDRWMEQANDGLAGQPWPGTAGKGL